MIHHENDTTIARVMESMGDAFGILYNAAIELERAEFLGAGRYERSENRSGRANGFKDKNLNP